ncbi:MAG: heat shock protein HspQ [Gammaproteobacteria bacterium]|nr:heat shock protein HspQ [Gammaproteobacteria bacterium]
MQVKFAIGQIVHHLKVGYRGVVFEVDAEFSLSEEWYETVAVSRPPRDRPWYHVLVDGAAHTTYVAERHLEASADSGQIAHPLLGQYFESYDGRRYHARGVH